MQECLQSLPAEPRVLKVRLRGLGGLVLAFAGVGCFGAVQLAGLPFPMFVPYRCPIAFFIHGIQQSAK